MTSPESPRQAVVARYMEGSRASDREAILSTLTDDVAWIIHGARTTRGKAEFDSEIENPHFEGGPELTVERMFESGDHVAITGTGIGRHCEAGQFEFAFNDIVTFCGDLIAQIDSYVALLPALESP